MAKKILGIALILLGITQAFGQIYVSPNGNDAGAGTIDQPFATVQHALDQAQPGDTIYLRQGVYYERLVWTNSGQVQSPIVLRNYPDETAVIDGTNASNSSQNPLLSIQDKSYIRISGLVFRNNYRQDAAAITFYGQGTDIVIENCEIYNIGWTDDPDAQAGSGDNAHAIVFVGTQADPISNLLIRNNYIHNCITGYSEALTLVGNVQEFVIEQNRLDSITNIGIDVAGHWDWTGAPADVNFVRNGIIRNNVVSNCISPYAASAGIYSDGAQDIVIMNNVLFGNRVGISVGVENDATASNIRVLNNLCYNNLDAGIYFGGSFANNGVVTQSILSGNTLYHNDLGYNLDDWTGEIILNRNSDCQVVNNLVIPRSANNKKAIIALNDGTTNVLVDYCLFWRENGDGTNFYDWGTGNSYTVGTHMIVADPLLADVQNADFHLTANSPAINAGDPQYSPITDETDIDGQPRILQSVIDIGADEYSGASLIAVLQPELKVYPNPATDFITVEATKSIAEVQIISADGKVVKNLKLQGTKTTINIADLPAGLYLIRANAKSLTGFIKL